MAKVKSEVKVLFREGNVYIHWNVNDEDGYGVDITGENGIGGDLIDLGGWSFGLSEEMERLSQRWFAYVVEIIQEQGSKLEEKGDHVIPQLLEHISSSPTKDEDELSLIRILVDTDMRKERMVDNTLRGIEPDVEIMKASDENSLLRVREEIERRMCDLLPFFVMLEENLDDDEVEIYMHTDNCEELGEKEYAFLKAIGISEDNSIRAICELLSIDIQFDWGMSV
ncbi:hypothetical protein [Anaerobacillus sp. 1_MG-2023]|uniref:hypothetical protein n=1 Tax=Anaerobacillus sp. 1_MG-2023 TaxID=3062655 RepID=UPI0026E3DBAD|nr:hypothetical protein [Anaerobacillus sp. 1_MG-2023]MDO6657446.1 hypothetical protein [Anaerobacillus sp. 1_MG-2023]